MARHQTCWTLIRAAAVGSANSREQFARHYAAIVRSYLEARWARHHLRSQVDDAVQDVFFECFKADGVLASAAGNPPRSFRAFLHGVARNVALRHEREVSQERLNTGDSNPGLDQIISDQATLSRTFDRAWALAILREAAVHQVSLVPARGEDAARRVELLQLRFHDGRPIRDIARMWDADPSYLHHELARARREFKSSLFTVLRFHNEGSHADLEKECAMLLELLGADG